MFGKCFMYFQSVLKFENDLSFEMKISSNKRQKFKSFEMLQNQFRRLFKHFFYASFDIFIFTNRTSLMFLPTHSLMFGEY